MKKLHLQQLNRLSINEYKDIKKLEFVVVLDNIRSMHNVGSVFRTCDAFRAKELILCGITACPPQREINKTALGATDSVKWSYHEKTIDVINLYKKNGYLITGVEQTDQSVNLEDFSININKKYVLVFGNEVNGIEDEVVEMSDYCLEIPQFGTKHSLNVAVSAGIILYKFCSQLIKVEGMAK